MNFPKSPALSSELQLSIFLCSSCCILCSAALALSALVVVAILLPTVCFQRREDLSFKKRNDITLAIHFSGHPHEDSYTLNCGHKTSKSSYTAIHTAISCIIQLFAIDRFYQSTHVITAVAFAREVLYLKLHCCSHCISS